MRLSNVDLNLFIVFDVIYTHRNLTRAAEVLCITQPAVSNALARLRKSFNDELFVRTPQAMVPTPIADNIVIRVREALQLLNASVQEGDLFQPATAQNAFRISMNSLPEALLLPALQQDLQRQAPGIQIASYYSNRQDAPKELAAGTLDLAIEVPLLNDPQLCHTPLMTERYVCMIRKDHPSAGEALTMERYLGLGHIHISSRRKGWGHTDLALSALGKERKIQLRVQHYMVAPLVAMQTDLALTVPLRWAQQYDAKILELPFQPQQLEWHLYWHKSADQDQANRWLRERLLHHLNSEVPR
jgi:DNA-binding transcriptional LysR family regulator